MRAVVQRVSEAIVSVDDKTTGQIQCGLLVYLAAAKQDGNRDADWIANKIASLRVFSNDEAKMSRSVCEVKGEVLVVSQFTLYGDVRKGRRPSFDQAADPDLAEALYNRVCTKIRSMNIPVETGQFRAMMMVRSVNEGPVTIPIDSHKAF